MDTLDLPADTTVYLKDYTPAPFLISQVDLDIPRLLQAGVEERPHRGPDLRATG